MNQREELVAHCNIKQNAELIAKILDADIQNEGFVCAEQLFVPKARPHFISHDHEEYFSAEVRCGCCLKRIGEYDYGAGWAENCKERFIQEYQYCQRCGTKIIWEREEE